ncbi:MAG TPA: DUF4276 family protein [Verrucomicrobiae bacterium]|jgi:hypothetical protein
MSWVRLYVTVEGQTEKEFADQILKPHLAGYSIDVRPRVVVTNRKLGKRGGIFDFDKIKGDVCRLMKEDRSNEARFTTMIDLYALPSEFPGWAEARRKSQSLDRIGILEKALETEFADARFLPFIQLHEFETLLYCDLGELQRRIANSESKIKALTKEVLDLEPEDINEGVTTAPSKRIIRHIPIYERNKVRVGAPAAAAIGLSKLRAKCPHFGSWISRLEALGHLSQPI